VNSSERVGAMHHNDADGAVRCGRVGDAEDRRKRTIAVVAVARWKSRGGDRCGSRRRVKV